MAIDSAARLDRALRAVPVPILGVTIGVEADRATWVIHYAPEATLADRTTGDALRLAFDPTSAAASDAETASLSQTQAALKERLADLALLASVTDATWAASTLAQKIAKVRALANTWQTLRAFVEKNL